jgi:hypothetical protein
MARRGRERPLNVVLAQTRGTSFTLVTLIITLIQNPLIIKHANILEIYMSYQKKLRNQIYLS